MLHLHRSSPKPRIREAETMPTPRFAVLFIFAVAFLPAVTAKADGPNEAFVGTWVLESDKIGKGEAVDHSATKKPRETLLVTGPHFIWGSLDPVKMKIVELRHAGQLTETENKGTFSEFVEYGGRNRGMEGKSYVGTWRLDGDKLIKTGESNGEIKEQVFVRFLPAPMAEDTGSTTLGQQLIDLKKAKDAGALSAAEFEKEKARLLQGSGK